MTIRTVALTDNFRVQSGSHILYFYDQLQKYIDNAVSFIITGIQQQQHVLFIDNPTVTEGIKTRVRMSLTEEDVNKINFVDNRKFYYFNDRFEFNCVLHNFLKTIQPYLDNEISLRAWGHIEWREQDNILNELNSYECQSDVAINQLGILTVCAYSAQNFSASIQQRMMKFHQYMMTDDEFTRSSLYNKAGTSVIFPSLAEHDKIMDEVDLYKQKLDFVHVVSHEVRNPLTVINAYAALLINDELIHEEAKNKLLQIKDYVTVIDHEITHVINTEQMLTSESLWRKGPISPFPILQEVIEMLSIKARTQGVHLQSKLHMTGREIVNSNKIGLRLIISNLLSNAIKYSNEGTEVQIEAGVRDEFIWVHIEDHGIGIDEQQQRLLFQKYSKTNTEKSGQGIGLYMVKKLVDHFDGGINLISELNKGTIVKLQIPLLCSGAAEIN